jgi:hypothetical protein
MPAELTPDELQSWIEKRASVNAEWTNLHLWDHQAMCYLKAERDRLSAESSKDTSPARRLAVDWTERAKASDANAKRFYEQSERRLRYITECQQLLGTHDNLQTAIEKLIQERDQWCEAYDEQIRLNLLDKAELVRLRETLAEVRKQLAEAQTYL